MVFSVTESNNLLCGYSIVYVMNYVILFFSDYVVQMGLASSNAKYVETIHQISFIVMFILQSRDRNVLPFNVSSGACVFKPACFSTFVHN